MSSDFTLGRIGFSPPDTFVDTFERSDRLINGNNGWSSNGIATIGSTTLDPTRALEIQTGQLVLDSASDGAGYAWRRLQGLTEVRIRFQFASGSTDNAAIGLILSNNTGSSPIDIALNSVHIVITPAGRQVSFYDGAIVAASDTDLFTLSTGTEYEFVARVSGNTLYITDPDGGTETITSSSVGSLWGDTLLVECLHPTASLATDKLPKIDSVEGTVISSSLDLKCTSWKQEGDQATVTGIIRHQQTVQDLLAVRDAVLGYSPENTDEPVVPITWANDPSKDGFYKVLGCEVDNEVTGRPILDGDGPELAYAFSLDLLRVPGWKAPVIEVTRTGADRSNVHTITDGVGLTFLPGSAKVPRWESATSGNAFVATEDGSTRGYAGSDYENSVTYMVDPASFYESASKIEVSYDEGVTWNTVTGRQVDNLPDWVRISNGKLRVTASVVSGNTVLATEVWDDAAVPPVWERTDFNVTSGSGTGFAFYTHPFVSGPQAICSGPDGNLWFTGFFNDRIWRVTPAGVLTTYTNANINGPVGITTGPDGNIWFASLVNNRIGKITTSGTVTTYTNANISGPRGICSGPDGLLWFTSYDNDRIGKITTSGTVTTYTTGVGNAPNHICSGPDGNLWYTRTTDNAICEITTAGSVTTHTSGVPTGPNYICSDGADLWFTYADGIGKITTAGSVTTFTNANIDNPQGVVEGPDGNIWFTNLSNNRIGTYDPATTGQVPLEFAGTLTILRNSPEAVAIRLGAAAGDESLDLTLRRGYNLCEGYVSGTSAEYGCFRTESETGASVTGGIEANAANTDGNKYTIFSPRTITKDTTGVSGVHLTAAATSFPFAISPVNDSTLSGLATIKQAYFGANNHRQQVSVR